MKKLTTRKIAYMGLFIGLVYASSKILEIPYMTPFGKTRFHLGNVLCLLAGILLGPVHGGLAAGLGSALYDLVDPIFLPYAPSTFINKFLMAAVAGFVYNRKSLGKEKTRIVLGSVLGQVTYIILYLLNTYVTNYIIQNLSREAVMADLIQKAGVSSINGIISVILASLLAVPLLKNIKFED